LRRVQNWKLKGRRDARKAIAVALGQNQPAVGSWCVIGEDYRLAMFTDHVHEARFTAWAEGFIRFVRRTVPALVRVK
jgi:hypothetical protein